MKRHWRLVLYVCLICLPLLLLANPYFRQSLFGPKIDGVPLHGWQHDMRRTFSADRHKPTFMEKVYAVVGIDNRYYMPGFSSPPKGDPEILPVLINLSNDNDKEVRRWVAYYLGFLPDQEDAVATLNYLLTDPALEVRHEAKNSLGRCEAMKQRRRGVTKDEPK